MNTLQLCLPEEPPCPARRKINDGVGVGIDEKNWDAVIAILDSLNLYGCDDDDDGGVNEIVDQVPFIQESEKDDKRIVDVDVEDPLLFKILDPNLSRNNVDIKNRVEEVYDGTEIYDIDANLQNPNLLCPELADEVMKNLRLMEVEIRAETTNNDGVATKIGRRSRAECVERLVDAAQKLNCASTTLHLAVNYFDRYSCGNPIEIKDLFMVSLTCLMIASKFDGVSSEFDFDKYVDLGGGICGDELLGMEERVLNYMEYDVMGTTACSFLGRFVGAAQCGRHAPLQGLEGMAAGLAELSLFSTTMLRSFLPSMVAASSVFLARYVLEPSQEPWNATLRHYTMYEASDLKDCVLALDGLWWRRPLNEYVNN